MSAISLQGARFYIRNKVCRYFKHATLTVLHVIHAVYDTDGVLTDRVSENSFALGKSTPWSI